MVGEREGRRDRGEEEEMEVGGGRKLQTGKCSRLLAPSPSLGQG